MNYVNVGLVLDCDVIFFFCVCPSDLDGFADAKAVIFSPLLPLLCAGMMGRGGDRGGFPPRGGPRGAMAWGGPPPGVSNVPKRAGDWECPNP